MFCVPFDADSIEGKRNMCNRFAGESERNVHDFRFSFVCSGHDSVVAMPELLKPRNQIMK